MKNVLIFLAGLSIGSAGTYIYVNKVLQSKYEALYDEEVESVRNAYKKAIDEKLDSIAEEKYEAFVEAEKRAEVIDYSSMAKEKIVPDEEEEIDISESEAEKEVETDMAEAEAEEHVKKLDKNSKPYLIDETAFYSYDGYDKETLALYSDGYLAEESTDTIVDVKEYVGNCLNELRRNNSESIFVRNEWLGFDYQVYYDTRTYYEVTGIYPRQE